MPGQVFRVVDNLDGEVRRTYYRAAYGPCRYGYNVPAIRTRTVQWSEAGHVRYRRGPYRVHAELHRLTPVEVR